MILTLMLDALWQGALVIVATLLVVRFVPIANAKTRYVIWWVALLALVAVPIATSTVRLPFSPMRLPTAGNGTFSLVPFAPLSGEAQRWLAWPSSAGGSIVTRGLAVVWALGALLGILRILVSCARIAHIRRRAVEIARVEGIPVLSSCEIAIPIATGIVAPAIVLPADLASASGMEHRACTIEHELAHVRRCDVASNAVARIVEALFFWNPWMHAAGRRLVAEREAACDDWAVRRLGEPTAYASSLAALARAAAPQPAPLLTPSASGSRHALVTRIERLFAERPAIEPPTNYLAIAGLVVLFASLTVGLQALLPIPARAVPVEGPGSAAVATACSDPNASPKAIVPAPPQLPRSQWPSRPVTAIVAVTVAPDGKPAAARIYRSSGDAGVDRAVLAAAEKSTYSPKLVNCAPARGTYLFKATFGP